MLSQYSQQARLRIAKKNCNFSHTWASLLAAAASSGPVEGMLVSFRGLAGSAVAFLLEAGLSVS